MNFVRYAAEIERASRHLNDAATALQGEPAGMDRMKVAAALGAAAAAQARLVDAMKRLSEKEA